MNKSISLRIATLLLFFSFLFSTSAQNKPYDNHRFQLGISLDVYNKLILIETGKSVLKSNYSPAPKLTFNYDYYIKDLFGINGGVGLTLIPHSLSFRFKKLEDGITTYNDGTKTYHDTLLNETFFSYIHSAYSINLSIEKRFSLSKNHFLNAGIGVEANFLLNYPYSLRSGQNFIVQNSTPGSDDYPVFEYELHESKSRVLFAYFFKIGYYKQFVKGNTLGFNFKLNYSPQLLGVGTYKFSNFPYESYGDLKWDINHVGIEMVYGFLPIKNKKKLKKESEIEKF